MKFLSLIASAMLIALISQHSIMGLPLNGTVVCSEGMELIGGQCVLISVFNTSIGYENGSQVTDILPLHIEQPSSELTPIRIVGRCPPGMQHGENGICEDIQTSTSGEVNLSTTSEFLDQPTTEFVDVSSTTEFNVPTRKLKAKAAASQTTAETPRDYDEFSTTTPVTEFEATTEFVDESTTTELNTPSTRRFKGKSAAFQTTAETPRDYDEFSTTTSEANIEATTELVGESTTTELNTPSTRRFNGKSATSSTTAETPSDYDEFSTSTTTEASIEATTEFNTPSTRRFKGKSATSSTTAETPRDYDELSTTTTPVADFEATTEFIDESTTTESNVPTRKIKAKLATSTTTAETPSDYDELSTTTEFSTSSTRRFKVKSATSSTTAETPRDYDEFSTTTESSTPSTRRFKVKSTTFKTSTEIPSDYDEFSTTTERDENVGGVDIIKGCPKGTQPDQDGACVSAQPINSTKVITNLKVLLVNGSCPTDYKMIQGRCLYTKSKKTPTLYQTGVQPKSSVSSQSEDELVPVLDDNSCPEGTEYSEFGLCRKRIYATTPRLSAVNKSQYSHSKSTSRVILTTTPSEEEFSVSETTPAVEEESAYENHTEETSSPL